MTNVRWAVDDTVLVSVGGADTAIMVWAHGKGKATIGDAANDDTDSEEEGRLEQSDDIWESYHWEK